MKRFVLPMLVSLAVSAAAVRPAWGDDPPAKEDDLKAVAASSNAFAMELYGQLRSQEGNLFLSPYSVHSALSMLHAGAAGQTEKEMAKVLHISLPPERLDAALAELRSQLVSPEKTTDKTEDYSLRIANRLWGRSGAAFLEGYLERVRRDYGATPRELDFVADPDAARGIINDWVKEQSRGKIENLLMPGSVNDQTQLVLTNVIYFLGNWPEPFDPRQTKKADFHVSPERKVQVPMMHRVGLYGLRQNHGTKALSIHYRGYRLQMVVLLPEKRDGLKALEESLSAEALASWHSTEMRELDVYLPKFVLQSQFGLTDALRSLGMGLAFSGEADFSGMSAEGKLAVTSVIHKAVVRVDETGSEAAAATGISVGAAPGLAKPAVFRADHPFLFLIQDEATGCILFMGRVVNP